MKISRSFLALVILTCAIGAFGQSPRSDIITLQSAATATGNGTALDVSLYGGVAVQITGSFTATITFEATIDRSNWIAVKADNVNDRTSATTATAAGIYQVPLSGAVQFRARISAYTSGTITVKARGVAGQISLKQSSSGGGGGAVDSVFGRTGTVTAASNDYTWAQIDKTTSSLADITTRSASDLSSGTLPSARIGALGTPTSGTATNITGLPISTGVSGLGTGIATALAINTGSAGAPVLFNGAGGTPSSLTLTNATSLPPTTGISGWPANASGVLTNNGSGTLSWAAASSGITIDSTAITSGTAQRVLFESATNKVSEAAGFTFDGTSALTLGVAGTSVGSVAFKNATSGTITLQPVTGALGTVTLSLPATTSTLAGLGIAQTFTANQAITATVSTGTGTSSGFSVAADSLTTGTGANFASSSVTSGSVVNIASTSTAAASSTLKGLNIAISGANGTTAQTVTGAAISVTNTNATSGTNKALVLTASGATTANTALDVTAGVVSKTQDSIGTTSTDGVVIQNTTAAAAGAQQYSPRLRLTGQGWKTNATAASQTVDWIVENQPVQGAANPTTNLVFASQVNGGGYTTRATLDSAGVFTIPTSGAYILVDTALGGSSIIRWGSATGRGMVPVNNGVGLVNSSNEQFFSNQAATSGRSVAFHSAALVGWAASGGAEQATDLNMRRNAAANLAFGATDAASPVAQTLSVQNVVGGTSNTAGATRTEIASLGTSQGAPGRYHIQAGAMIAASGTTQQTAIDRGIFGATKVLTNNSATTIVNVTNASNTSTGGVLDYCVEVTDGTDTQYECGMATYGISNKAGAFSGNTVTKFGNHQNATAGTLTVTIAISGANPGLLSVNANSSLTPSTGYPRIVYSLRNNGNQAVAVQ